jgi:hypothetical protein
MGKDTLPAPKANMFQEEPKLDMEKDTLLVKMPLWGKVIIAIMFAILVVLLISLIVEYWIPPDKHNDGDIVLYIRMIGELDWGAYLILMAALFGALGSCVNCISSFSYHAAKCDLSKKYTIWYILHPFIGSSLAVLVYFVIKGALVTDNTPNVYGVFALSGISGMCNKQATTMLKNVFEIIFSKAKEEEKEYTITAKAEAHGTITPSGDVKVNHGASQKFAIIPDEGYHIADVIVDGKSVGSMSIYSFENVTANHTISVTFEINTYKITAVTAGNIGSITPSGEVKVNHGASQKFTIEQGPGLKKVYIDGKLDDTVISEYEFKNVTADHIIVVLF